jgi:hypothetical protein
MKTSYNRIIFIIGALAFVVAIYVVYESFRPLTHTEKLAEIISLEDSRQHSERLTAYTDDIDPVLRARAALAIGRIGEAQAAPRLFEMDDFGRQY